MSGKLIVEFLRLKTRMELYHWTTRSYDRHLASGEFYKAISSLIDKYVEVSQSNKRTILRGLKVIKVKQLNDKEVVVLLKRFRRTLKNNSPRSELKNIISDMIEVVDKTLYLFSMK